MGDKGPTLERIVRVLHHPVRFIDNGAERCLTLDEAAALRNRIGLAIEVAHEEIRGAAEQTSEGTSKEQGT